MFLWSVAEICNVAWGAVLLPIVDFRREFCSRRKELCLSSVLPIFVLDV